jgi:hypothetical protein
MIKYQGSGYYAILVIEKVLKVFYYSTWGEQETAKLGEPFVVNSEKEFWECVAYVIQDNFL